MSSVRNGGFAIGPMLDDISHDFVADDLSGFQSRKVGGIIAGNHGLETVGCTCAGRLSVVIADRAKHQNALEIDAIGLAKEREGLYGAGVLHGGDHVIPFAAGVVAGPGVGPLIHF